MCAINNVREKTSWQWSSQPFYSSAPALCVCLLFCSYLPHYGSRADEKTTSQHRRSPGAEVRQSFRTTSSKHRSICVSPAAEVPSPQLKFIARGNGQKVTKTYVKSPLIHRYNQRTFVSSPYTRKKHILIGANIQNYEKKAIL